MTITYRIDGGASSHGFGYWSRWALCPRKATLDDIAWAVAAEGDPFDPAEGLHVGLVCHAFLDLHYSGLLDDVDDVEILPTPPDEVLTEAKRLVRARLSTFPRDHLGDTLFVEMPIESSEVVAAAVGVSPFTGRADRVVQLNAEQVSAAQALHPGLVGLTPGRYLVDLKFLKARSRNFELAYRYSNRFVAYQLAWNAAHPEAPVDGLIVDVTFKYKDAPRGKGVTHEAVLVPAPDAAAISACREFLARCRRIRDEEPTACNATDDLCFGWEPCRWFRENICDRTTATAPVLVRAPTFGPQPESEDDDNGE